MQQQEIPRVLKCARSQVEDVWLYSHRRGVEVTFTQVGSWWREDSGSGVKEATAKVLPKAKGKQGNGGGKQAARSSYLQLTAERIYFYWFSCSVLPRSRMLINRRRVVHLVNNANVSRSCEKCFIRDITLVTSHRQSSSVRRWKGDTANAGEVSLHPQGSRRRQGSDGTKVDTPSTHLLFPTKIQIFERLCGLGSSALWPKVYIAVQPAWYLNLHHWFVAIQGSPQHRGGAAVTQQQNFMQFTVSESSILSKYQPVFRDLGWIWMATTADYHTFPLHCNICTWRCPDD